MELWRSVWRRLVNHFGENGLRALRDALASNDARLIQGATSFPPPMHTCMDAPIEGACPIGFCGWQDGLETVGEVDEFFARIAFAVDGESGEPGHVRWFTNTVDEWKREELIANLLPEVRFALGESADPVAA